MLLAKHFQNIRKSDFKSSGLYASHLHYSNNISLLICSLSFATIISAIHAYPGVIADQLLDNVWPILCEVNSPWLVPFYFTNQQTSTYSSPCSIVCIDAYKKMLQILMLEPIEFLLEILPGTYIHA